MGIAGKIEPAARNGRGLRARLHTFRTQRPVLARHREPFALEGHQPLDQRHGATPQDTGIFDLDGVRQGGGGCLRSCDVEARSGSFGLEHTERYRRQGLIGAEEYFARRHFSRSRINEGGDAATRETLVRDDGPGEGALAEPRDECKTSLHGDVELCRFAARREDENAAARQSACKNGHAGERVGRRHGL